MARKVLVQAGHVAPREPGIDGVGTVREQEFALGVQNALVRRLAADPAFVPIAVPGDIPDGIRVDAAVFLHGDGSGNPAVSGFCFGYPDHAANRHLADLIAEELLLVPGHPPRRRDNYTRDLEFYYGFRKVATAGPEVVVEHGFLTNPVEQAWLFSNIGQIARAEHRALRRYFGMPPEVGNRRLKTLRDWLLARKRGGRAWAWIKSTANWREYKRRGGK